MTSGGDLRMLGAVDGFAHTLVEVRRRIGQTSYYPLPKHHRRKIAAREHELKQMRALEGWLRERHTETKAAYEKTRG